MSVPVFLHTAVDSVQVGDAVVLTDAEGRHAVSALRVSVGEVVDLVDGSGNRARCFVESITGRDTCRVQVSARSADAEPALRFVVAQALLKGEHDERAIDLLTQVGVDAIIPMQVERCVVRWDAERETRGRARWQAASGAAARQSRRARWPIIDASLTVDGVANLCRTVELALLLDPYAQVPIGNLQMPASGTVLIIVGPEGGFTEGEAARMLAQGAQPVRLGEEVLRGSAAGFAALAACSAASRWRS